jgi:NitT/TauT family transport system substrate-binding protein
MAVIVPDPSGRQHRKEAMTATRTPTRTRSRRTPALLLAPLVVFGLLAAACGDGGEDAAGAGDAASTDQVTVKLGYFPNVTHAPGIVGDLGGLFEDAVGDGVTIKTSTYNAGPEAVEALFAEDLDITLIGPNPAINAFAQSNGDAIRIVSGSTSGGAFLVVRDGIDAPEDLEGKALATPQLGNTQDVALRAWLLANGLGAKESGGNVSVLPTANADILTLFQRREIDAAWVPEPWATRLVQEANGRVFLDERSLWPGGEFVTTHLIVRTSYLEKHPDVVEGLVRAHVEATAWINANPVEARQLVNKNIEAVTSRGLPQTVLDAAWANLTITNDPISSSLKKSADDAFKLGFLGSSKPDLANIYDLEILNKVLGEKDLPLVKGN